MKTHFSHALSLVIQFVFCKFQEVLETRAATPQGNPDWYRKR